MKTSRFFVPSVLAFLTSVACSDQVPTKDSRGSFGRLSDALMWKPLRPSLVNHRLPTPITQSSHALTWDGRLIVGTVGLDLKQVRSLWRASVLRPEGLTYDQAGVPSFFNGAFSQGVTLELGAGENALSFCFEGSTNPDVVRGQAIYGPWIIDSQMFGGPSIMRRRSAFIRVSSAFTANAEVAEFALGTPAPLQTGFGGVINGIEPALTADGRLMVYQGGPDNGPDHDHLMYSYNPVPCALTGWSLPHPLSALYSDAQSRPELQRYPLAWKPLRGATGDAFAPSLPGQLIRAAYPWIDPEGRNVLYAAVMHTDNARREAMTLIGVDTQHTAYHIDGAINSDRYDFPHLFYSSPMWKFERERHPSQNFPPGASNATRFLPVTKTHDVLPLFGGNTSDYNEVDLGDLIDPFYLLYLPLNELVTNPGAYDLRRTPDLSGRYYTGSLNGTAEIDPSMAATMPSENGANVAQPPPSRAWLPHGKGRALRLDGNGSVTVPLAPAPPGPGIGSTVRGFSVELAIKPSALINQGCAPEAGPRYLLSHPNLFDLKYHRDNTVELGLVVSGAWIRLGKSPPLAPGSWTELAYTWDGVTGKFAEYVNAIATGRTLPTAPGYTVLAPGTLVVGSSMAPDPAACPGPVGGSFIGHVDEVRLFTHARSARSVCLAARGVDCRASAIQQNPSGGHFGLVRQHPDCKDAAALGTLACQSALHRTCAQRGAIDALGSTNNLLQTVEQLISDRPPVSMLGIPTYASESSATIACSPIAHESLAVTYDDLAREHPGCTDERTAASLACMAASHRFCAQRGWTTGHLFESTTRAWVGCFNSAFIDMVPKSYLGPVSNAGQFEAAGSRLEVSAWCMFRGYEAGVVQELDNGETAHVHCFRSPAVVPWSFLP